MGQGVFKSQAAMFHSAPRTWHEAQRVPGQGHLSLRSLHSSISTKEEGKAVLFVWTQKGALLRKLSTLPLCSMEATQRASERSSPSLPLAVEGG